MVSRPDKFNAFREAFYRTSGANLTNVLATALIFMVVIFFQRFQVDLPVTYQKIRGQQGTFPIKLFYTSNMAIILHTGIVSNFYFLSEKLYQRYRSNLLVNLFGQWADAEFGQESVPVGGLAYYIAPPRSVAAIWMDPLHGLFYICFMLGLCGGLSKMWIEISGQSPRDVAKTLRDQQLQFKGYRESSLLAVLNLYIPTAAMLGGMCIACLTIIADFLGAIGSGTGILLAVNIVYNYVEMFSKEMQAGNILF